MITNGRSPGSRRGTLSGWGRPAHGRWVAGHSLKIAKVHMVADVAPRRTVRRVEIPRDLVARAERFTHGDTPLLALPDLAVHPRHIPPRRAFPPELPGQHGCRWIAGQVDLLVRIRCEVVELVRVGW